MNLNDNLLCTEQLLVDLAGLGVLWKCDYIHFAAKFSCLSIEISGNFRFFDEIQRVLIAALIKIWVILCNNWARKYLCHSIAYSARMKGQGIVADDSPHRLG